MISLNSCLGPSWMCLPELWNRSRSRSLPFEGDSNSGYIGFLCSLVDFRSISVTIKILLVHCCTLLCTLYQKNLNFLSIHREIHNHYITHDVLESESESHKIRTRIPGLLTWQNHLCMCTISSLVARGFQMMQDVTFSAAYRPIHLPSMMSYKFRLVLKLSLQRLLHCYLFESHNNSIHMSVCFLLEVKIIFTKEFTTDS